MSRTVLQAAFREEVIGLHVDMPADPLAIGLGTAAALPYIAAARPFRDVLMERLGGVAEYLPSNVTPFEFGIALGAAAVLDCDARLCAHGWG